MTVQVTMKCIKINISRFEIGGNAHQNLDCTLGVNRTKHERIKNRASESGIKTIALSSLLIIVRVAIHSLITVMISGVCLKTYAICMMAKVVTKGGGTAPELMDKSHPRERCLLNNVDSPYFL